MSGPGPPNLNVLDLSSPILGQIVLISEFRVHKFNGVKALTDFLLLSNEVFALIRRRR